MFSLLVLNQVPILEQLKIEEALLRADKGNWCVINSQVDPAIVLGISGKPEKLVNFDKLREKPVPLIKRFSGGGTVYVDPLTFFISFIVNGEALGVASQPRPILEWAERFYQPLFPFLRLRENDFVIGERKFGGNAQYLQKGRWLLHTSFLWDYEVEKMEYLLLPEKRPEYRKDRKHEDFLCCLRPHFASQEELKERVIGHLTKELGAVMMDVVEVRSICLRPHRQATHVVDLWNGHNL